MALEDEARGALKVVRTGGRHARTDVGARGELAGAVAVHKGVHVGDGAPRVVVLAEEAHRGDAVAVREVRLEHVELLVRGDGTRG